MENIAASELSKIFKYRNDGTLLWRGYHANNKIKPNDVAGSTSTGYVVIDFNNVKYRAHRIIFAMHHGYFPEGFVDHINQNKLDNRIENLREVSVQCNNRNCKTRKDNDFGVKGVSIYRASGKWRSRIRVNGKLIEIGFFDNFDEAVCHRLAYEQCFHWSGCDSTSPAYRYVNKNISKRSFLW